MHLLQRERLRGGGVEFFHERLGARGEFAEERGADREQVAAGQFGDLALIAEARAHDFGLVAELFVVVVNLRDGNHAGILGRRVILFRRGLPPVEDAPDERRDELHFRLRAGHGLGHGKKQREIAVDAFLFQHLGGFDALPRRSDLDQNAVAREAGLFIERDELAALGDGARGVERQARVGFRRDATGDDLEDFETEGDEDAVHRGVHIRRSGDGLIHDRGVLRLGRGGEDERGIRGRVLRLESAHGLEIARVGDDLGEFLERIELAQFGGGGCFGGGGAHGVFSGNDFEP